MAEFKSTISSQDFDKALQGGLDYAADKEDIQSALAGLQAGGMTATARNLLITILRNGVYNSDQSANIANLNTALGGEAEPDEPDVPVVTTYTVTNNLTNVTNSNAETSVTEGASYTATITPDEGYELESVTVIVGGVDVTASVYANGIISISGVSGDVVITATAVEIPMEDDENNGWVDGQAYTINWTDGYGIDNSDSNGTFGQPIENESRSVSDFLPCRGASAIMVGSGVYGNYGMWYYDENKELLQRTISATGTTLTTYPHAIPLGAYYCRVQCITDYKDDATVTPVKFAVLDETTPWEAGEYYNLSYEEGGLNNNTGAVTTSNTHVVSNYALCYGAVKVSAMTTMNTYRTQLCFYDENKTVISGSTASPSSWDVPEGAKYFRHSCYNGDQYNNGGGMNNPWFVLE